MVTNPVDVPALGGIDSYDAICPGGTTAVGGGYSLDSGIAISTGIISNRPDMSSGQPIGWQVRFGVTAGVGLDVTVYAVCAS